MNLLPRPRHLKRGRGSLFLPARAAVYFDPSLPPDAASAIFRRLQSAAKEIGLTLTRRRGHEVIKFEVRSLKFEVVSHRLRGFAFENEAYSMRITTRSLAVEYGEIAGLRAAVATLRQLFREYGRRLPCLEIRDRPDFPRRGVMLDVSRGRVPKLATLLELVDHLADFKINEFQLYFEHTFAYPDFKPVWRDWGALTAAEIHRLDARCRELGIDLVPNQNSFGHLRAWLEYPPLRNLGEVAEPYESDDGSFLRRPSTLAPNHPGTLPFLRQLYDELLPNFSSEYFNVGCDETWDLGRGQSKELCRKKGKGRVYLDFLKQIHREVSRRGKRMMFWGDIVLNHPELISDLPRDLIALNWGYEADHPFGREARQFAKSGVPFYVCPGTSTWQTLIGKHDNALANLRSAARAGRKHGAIGYLITDWGDGGHPQPLAVSYLPYLAGAALSWCESSYDESKLVPVLSRDIFHDPTRHLAGTALALGLAHRKFGYREPNSTPFGTVIAAPLPESRELFCRNGLKLHERIADRRIRAAQAEVEKSLKTLERVKPRSKAGRILLLELNLAARMAAQSCQIMRWQQAHAKGEDTRARWLARKSMRELCRLEREFKALWRRRNKGTIEKSAPFLRWRRYSFHPHT